MKATDKITVELTLGDALAGGHEIRSIARDPRTPFASRLILSRVGDALADAAMVMLGHQPARDTEVLS